MDSGALDPVPITVRMDSFGGKPAVRWAPGEAVATLGQLLFFTLDSAVGSRSQPPLLT